MAYDAEWWQFLSCMVPCNTALWQHAQSTGCTARDRNTGELHADQSASWECFAECWPEQSLSGMRICRKTASCAALEKLLLERSAHKLILVVVLITWPGVCNTMRESWRPCRKDSVISGTLELDFNHVSGYVYNLTCKVVKFDAVTIRHVGVAKACIVLITNQNMVGIRHCHMATQVL